MSYSGSSYIATLKNNTDNSRSVSDLIEENKVQIKHIMRGTIDEETWADGSLQDWLQMYNDLMASDCNIVVNPHESTDVYLLGGEFPFYSILAIAETTELSPTMSTRFISEY